MPGNAEPVARIGLCNSLPAKQERAAERPANAPQVGDTVTLDHLITAWQADLRSEGTDANAAERRRIIQASFGIDLDDDPPALAQTWTPGWVDDVALFNAERQKHCWSLAGLARVFAALPPDEDPFDGLLEAPPPMHEFWLHRRTAGTRGWCDSARHSVGRPEYWAFPDPR